MSDVPRRITLDQWDARYAGLKARGLCEPSYGGPLRRHVEEGDFRLSKLRMDNSAAALGLWNFLLTEDDRLHRARADGMTIVGAMKDLGTVPVLVNSLPRAVAFYPDGAWWTPCIMEQSDHLLALADAYGIDDSFCPVRAMLGAFVNREHFPIPDLITCSVGATCDDLSAIAGRLESLGFPIVWWEMPHCRRPEPGERSVTLPGGFSAPAEQVAFVRAELDRVRRAVQSCCGRALSEADLAGGVARANRVRRLLCRLRDTVYGAEACPLPALEMLVAEMLSIHFCSDLEETERVLGSLIEEVDRRIAAGQGVLRAGAVRVFWVNPVADLRVMNLLEDAGGRIAGTEYLISHALEPLPDDLPPMEALARSALSDPMVGSPLDRAARVVREIDRLGAEALVVSRIPGASHCALEGEIITDVVRDRTGVPTLEIEVPPIADAFAPALCTRLEALVETARRRRRADVIGPSSHARGRRPG